LQKAPEPRIADITKDRGGMRRWKKHFLPHLLRFLRSYRIPNEPLTFVYGDTHFGGYGEIAADPEPVRVYNCGGWVVYDPADHPACHVFAVDSHGEEYLADLSFADVKVGDVSLLETAVGSRKPAVIPQETESGAYSHSLVREVVSGSKSLLI
jgi:hypothetical protein